MTDTEKELLQAKHRLEEAQARDWVKERKARTHRLIQIGAIFVKACPELAYMDLKELLGREVDLIEEGTLRPYARKSAEQDKVLIYERKN